MSAGGTERAERSRPLLAAPGLLSCSVIAIVATALGTVVPVVGAPVIAIVIGVALSRSVGQRTLVRPGIALAGKLVLQVAVVLLGAQLSLRQIASVGLESLPVMLSTVGGCLMMGFVVGRALRIEYTLRTLIAVGTAICGASAIAAVSPTIRAKNSAISYAISTIFLFNVAAVLLFPLLGHLLGLSQHAFGLFAGTAVNDTSSVVAAATSYGSEAGRYAVVVKLTRSLLIIPICLLLGAMTQRRDRAEGGVVRVRVTRLVPWFLVGFVLVAGLGSIGVFSDGTRPVLQTVASFLIAVALAGIGLSTDLAALRRAGARPLLLGAVLWVTIASISIGVQAI